MPNKRHLFAAPLSIIAFVFVATSAFAQTATQKWASSYTPGYRAESGKGIAIDQAGDVFFLGTKVISAGTPEVPDPQQFYLVKYAGTDGHVLWVKTFSGSAPDDYPIPESVAVDPAGNVAVTGAIKGLSGAGVDRDIYTIKYSGADGTLLWERRYNNSPTNSLDAPEDIAMNQAGDVIVTGGSFNTGTSEDVFTICYDSADGHTKWERRVNGTANGPDRAWAVIVDNTGSILVTGEWSPGGVYVGKYDGADGQVIWEGALNGGQRGRALAVDGSGHVAVAGVLAGAGGGNLFAAKFHASTGGVIWERSYDAELRLDTGDGVATDARGDVFVTGQSETSTSSGDFYTAKYAAADGHLLWEKRFNGAANRRDEARGITLDRNGNPVVMGDSVLANFNTELYTASYNNADGSLLWEQHYIGESCFQTTHPIARTPDGGIVIAGTLTTIKYAVEGGGAGGLWAAGRDLLANEEPDNAAEGNAINARAPEWSYGYRSSAASTALTLFTPAQHINDANGLEGWIAPGQATLGVNTKTAPIIFNTGSGNYKALLPTQMYLSPGSGNEFLVVRWTAPDNGDYRAMARWVDIDQHGGNGATAYLLKNGQEQFSKTFRSTTTSTGRAWMRSRVLSLNAGDVLDFVVGSDGEHTFDATAFNAAVRRVPKVTITSPASGSILTGQVTFNVDVQHSEPIESVAIFFNEQTAGLSDLTSPYSIVAAPKPGYHKVVAVATDADGVMAQSAEVVVIVPPPTAQQSEARKGPMETDSSSTIEAVTPGRLFFSSASGPWNDPATWGNAGVPGRWDYAIISPSHNVVIDFGTGTQIRHLTVNGDLSGGGSPGNEQLDVYGTLHANGRIENLDLYINGPAGKFLILGQSPILRFVNVINQGKFVITAEGFNGEGVTIENRGSIKAGPPVTSQGPLVVPVTGFNQLGGQTTLGVNTVLRAPDGVNLNGLLQLSPYYAPAISENGAGVVSNHGGSLISDNGAALIGLDGGTLIGDYGSGFVSKHGGALIGLDGGTLLGPDGFPMIGNAGGTIISEQGGGIHPTQVTPGSAAQASPTPGTITLNGGTITGTGEIRGNVINQGAFIAPGNSAGGIVVNGNYTQGGGSTLVLELGGKTFFDSFSYDVFQVAGTATLGGNLVVKTINGFTPASGDTVSALLYGSRTGTFASISSNAQVTLGADAAQVTTNGANPQGPRALNISTRLQIQSGDNALFAGFIVTGPAGSTKKVLIRGIGPSLAQFGVPGTIPDPFLELHSSGATITNDNWQQAPNANEIPNGFIPSDPRESVIIATLGPGNYSAILKGAHGETGVGLAEVYDLDPTSAAQLANIATRGLVQTGDTVLIGGFIVAGTEPAKVLVRAIGPSLSAFGVQGALQDTTLEVHDSNGGAISNDNWRETDEAAITGTGIPPSHNNEAAVLAILAPGNYTAVVRGADDTTGIAVVEAYNLSPQ